MKYNINLGGFYEISIFTGAGVAIITPFNEDGSINFEEFGKIIEDQIAGHTEQLSYVVQQVNLNYG